MSYTQKQHYPITSTPVHITYRLSGSIPLPKLRKLEDKRDQELFELEQSPDSELSIEAIKALNKKRFEIFAKYELSIDKMLHQIKTGPFHLKKNPVREIVIKSWKNICDRGIVDVLAVCVMGNHVHVILKAPDGNTSVSTASLMKSHKGFTARKANQVLGTAFESFWDGNYHDRKIRPGKFMAAMWYVLNNPVKAGLVENWSDWPGTYVDEEYIKLFQ